MSDIWNIYFNSPELSQIFLEYPFLYSKLLPIPTDPKLAQFIEELQLEHIMRSFYRTPQNFDPEWYLEGIKLFQQKFPANPQSSEMLLEILEIINSGINNQGLEELSQSSFPEFYIRGK